ncbi:Bax inhibitor-1/YccA family protein [Microbacterium gorillae]|uniref:Bax inhibitor-1/YccA family protein n=1 Tax=Microbacterium gorillae TaxID=1231063 RepID=UPI000A45680E|nr:Bax inhibitor-1/YccA family protein [Microbacterium gorillae]
MALRNPIFNNSAFGQDPRAAQTYPGGQQATSLTPPPAAPQAQQGGYVINGKYVANNPYDQQQTGQNAQWAAGATAAQNAAVSANMEGMYTAPPAGSLETGRMTVEDTVWKTAGLFGILLVAAVGGWLWTTGGVLSPAQATHGVSMVPWLVGALGGFVLAMVITFTSRKKVRPPLIFLYAAFEGVFVGAISAFFERLWPGVVMQATLATLAVVAVTLALFASGKIRASKRMTKIVLIAMIGYLVFQLVNIALMWTGVLSAEQTFGLYSAKIMGIPLGLIIGVLVVIMAAYSLVLDFDGIQQGVRNGAPRVMGWYGGFGIMVTVVWLYIEILRIIAIARSN